MAKKTNSVLENIRSHLKAIHLLKKFCALVKGMKKITIKRSILILLIPINTRISRK